MIYSLKHEQSADSVLLIGTNMNDLFVTTSETQAKLKLIAKTTTKISNFSPWTRYAFGGHLEQVSRGGDMSLRFSVLAQILFALLSGNMYKITFLIFSPQIFKSLREKELTSKIL